MVGFACLYRNRLWPLLDITGKFADPNQFAAGASGR